MADDINKDQLRQGDDVESIKSDNLLSLLSQMTSTDIEKLESMAKGDFSDNPQDDERLMKYLRVVQSIFGKGNTLMSSDQPRTRLSRYEIYDEMEETVAYISSALDILSDDATQPDEDGYVIHVKSDNSKVQNLVEQMVVNLELQEKVSKWARVIAKYGDFFLSIDGEEGTGVRRVDDTYYPGHIERKELDGELAAFIVTTESDVVQALRAPWEFIHFRHKGDIYRQRNQSGTLDAKSRYQLSGSYGQSILQPAIKVYTQLRFVENIILLSRLTNSIRRNIFLINVGDVSAEKSIESVQLYANLLKKDVTLDLDKGIYDSKKRSVTYDEDIFLPVSDTKNDVRIEQVGGDVNITEQYDLEYLLNKLFAALKIPKAYLNYEQDLNARSTLIQLDIRYARSVARLQQTIVGGLLRLAKIHLAYNGIDASNVDLNISLSSVSSIESEIRRQEREENINNARAFLDIMKDIKTTLEGESADGGADSGAFGEETPLETKPTQKVDLEYATYYVMREFLELKEDDIGKILKVDLKKYQENPQDDTNESKILKEHTVYSNSDNKAPLPFRESVATYESLRETTSENNKFTEVLTDES